MLLKKEARPWSAHNSRCACLLALLQSAACALRHESERCVTDATSTTKEGR